MPIQIQSPVARGQSAPEPPVSPESRVAYSPPSWVRVHDAIHATGISRSRLYVLMNEGKIRSASLRDKGQSKPTRLIDFGSLLSFIDSHANK